MRFEARELTTYATPVDRSRLSMGECYFQLTFVDATMSIPCLNPLFYIGEDIMDGDTGCYYFQDADSYISGLRYGEENDGDILLHSYDDKSLNNIFEFEFALEGLMRCSLQRKR